jgi:transposase
VFLFRVRERPVDSALYFWEYTDGHFRFFEHPVNVKQEEAYEGKYVIQTEERHVTPMDAVTIYKELSEVERAFANLKDVIEMRPIYHQPAARVRAHIFVAASAFLLHHNRLRTLSG